MHYTLHQLQIFLKIVQTESVTKAAEELYLTQPAVSIQLKNFQDQFDIPLTEIVGRKMYITEFGKNIAEVAGRIVGEIDTINTLTQAYEGKLTGRLTVSTVSTGKYVMPFFLTEFMKKHPGINLSMDVTNKQKVVENLERNEVDFALVSILPDHLNLNKIDLLVNKLYLVGSKEASSAPLIGSRNLFSNIPLIFREEGSGTRQAMEFFFQRRNLTVRKSMELTSNEAVKQAVLAGLGYSVMPIIGIRSELQAKSIKIIPFKGLPIKTMWQLTWPKGKKLSPVANAFINHIHEQKDKIIHRYFPQLEKIDQP